MKIKIAIILLVIFAAVAAAITLWPRVRQPAEKPIATAVFSCDGGKAIKATFYAGETIPSADPSKPPIPGGNVILLLSDGRALNLPHVVSADGGRYANSDESIVFWNRGDTAFITEKNVETYTNCVTSPSKN